MIQTIEQITALPSTPITELKALPAEPAIYFVTDAEHRVMYIGCTGNLKVRWNVHHRKKQAEAINGQIFYLTVPCAKNAKALEAELIGLFEPAWNRERIPDDYRQVLNGLDAQTSVRLDRKTLKRVDDIARHVPKRWRENQTPTRAAIIREALLLGVKALEIEIQHG